MEIQPRKSRKTLFQNLQAQFGDSAQYALRGCLGREAIVSPGRRHPELDPALRDAKIDMEVAPLPARSAFGDAAGAAHGWLGRASHRIGGWTDER
jgi:hypothetical protein